MMTGVSLSVTSANIALFIRNNENSLAGSYIRLTSGNRINNPSDGIPDYFYSEKLRRDNWSSENLLRGIEDGIAFADVASSAGESVFNALNDMREIVRNYYLDDTSYEDREAYAAEFNSLKDTITGIQSSSTYDGMNVLSDNGGNPFKRIALNNDGTITNDISFDSQDLADVSGLTLGISDEAAESSAVEAQMGRAGSYVAKTSAYMRGLNAHYNMTLNKIGTVAEASERITGADTGEEYVQSMNKSIQHQAAMAMLTQANMFRTSIIRLFE